MEEQEQYEENGLPGPGAPTPLSALDVSELFLNRGLRYKMSSSTKTHVTGHLWTDCQGY